VSQHIGILPPAFAAAVHDLGSFAWDRRVQICELEPPAHIAPYTAAIDAEVVVDGIDQATGRLILLHDPRGNQSWAGQFRCVTFAQAEVNPEMIHDPFLAHVGWSWLTEALAGRRAPYCNESGTITTTASTPFGAKHDEAQVSQIEIRASWTALLEPGHPLIPHLAAWQDLLLEIAGIPGEDETVVAMPARLAVRP
jgi:hypothetical protein